jgi:hypothetical protein
MPATNSLLVALFALFNRSKPRKGSKGFALTDEIKKGI